MLENLEKVNWKELTHAHGSAEDLPEKLLKLAFEPPLSTSDDPESTVLYTFVDDIFHQGSCYDATLAVIPFLIELLEHPSVQNKVDIMNLLANILHSLVHNNPDEMEDYTVEELEELYPFEKEIFSSILKGKEIFLQLRKTGDFDVRESAKLLTSALRKSNNNSPSSVRWDRSLK